MSSNSELGRPPRAEDAAAADGNAAENNGSNTADSKNSTAAEAKTAETKVQHQDDVRSAHMYLPPRVDDEFVELGKNLSVHHTYVLSSALKVIHLLVGRKLTDMRGAIPWAVPRPTTEKKTATPPSNADTTVTTQADDQASGDRRAAKQQQVSKQQVKQTARGKKATRAQRSKKTKRTQRSDDEDDEDEDEDDDEDRDSDSDEDGESSDSDADGSDHDTAGDDTGDDKNGDAAAKSTKKTQKPKDPNAYKMDSLCYAAYVACRPGITSDVRVASLKRCLAHVHMIDNYKSELSAEQNNFVDFIVKLIEKNEEHRPAVVDGAAKDFNWSQVAKSAKNALMRDINGVAKLLVLGLRRFYDVFEDDTAAFVDSIAKTRSAVAPSSSTTAAPSPSSTTASAAAATGSSDNPVSTSAASSSNADAAQQQQNTQRETRPAAVPSTIVDSPAQPSSSTTASAAAARNATASDGADATQRKTMKTTRQRKKATPDDSNNSNAKTSSKSRGKTNDTAAAKAGKKQQPQTTSRAKKPKAAAAITSVNDYQQLFTEAKRAKTRRGVPKLVADFIGLKSNAKEGTSVILVKSKGWVSRNCFALLCASELLAQLRDRFNEEQQRRHRERTLKEKQCNSNNSDSAPQQASASGALTAGPRLLENWSTMPVIDVKKFHLLPLSCESFLTLVGILAKYYRAAAEKRGVLYEEEEDSPDSVINRTDRCMHAVKCLLATQVETRDGKEPRWKVNGRDVRDLAALQRRVPKASPPARGFAAIATPSTSTSASSRVAQDSSPATATSASSSISFEQEKALEQAEWDERKYCLLLSLNGIVATFCMSKSRLATDLHDVHVVAHYIQQEQQRKQEKLKQEQKKLEQPSKQQQAQKQHQQQRSSSSASKKPKIAVPTTTLTVADALDSKRTSEERQIEMDARNMASKSGFNNPLAKQQREDAMFQIFHAKCSRADARVIGTYDPGSGMMDGEFLYFPKVQMSPEQRFSWYMRIVMESKQRQRAYHNLLDELAILEHRCTSPERLADIGLLRGGCPHNC